MARDSNLIQIWPDMQARITGESPWLPPFGDKLLECEYAFLAVSVPNLAFGDWLETIWRNSPEKARWKIVLALDPSYGTQQTGEVLELIYALQENSSGRLTARLLTPGKLGNAAPRLSMAILSVPGESVSASVGSSLSFGLGFPPAGDVNLWTTLSASQTNDIRQLARAYWELSAPLTKDLCDIPLLNPIQGNEAGHLKWQAFEAKITKNSDINGDSSSSIRDLPLTHDGRLDEEAIETSESDPQPELEEYLPKIPSVVDDIQSLYGKGALVSVQHRVKPMSVSIPPSLFGQQGEEQFGALRYKQQFRIELFSDKATAKEVDKQRKIVTELVQLFSFSFGTGKYWVPNTAHETLHKAIKVAGEKSQPSLKLAYGGDIEKFLAGRKPAIQQDLENIYKRFYPNGTMPSDSVDNVLKLLTERVKEAEKEGLVPKITSTEISFRYSKDDREDPWSDAAFLLSKIAVRPRELMADRFKPRQLKIAEIPLPDYLKVMNVMGDDLIAYALKKGPESPWAIDRSRHEMETLNEYETIVEPGENKCQMLIDLIMGVEPSPNLPRKET